jgi:hypothetical protein
MRPLRHSDRREILTPDFIGYYARRARMQMSGHKGTSRDYMERLSVRLEMMHFLESDRK